MRDSKFNQNMEQMKTDYQQIEESNQENNDLMNSLDNQRVPNRTEIVIDDCPPLEKEKSKDAICEGEKMFQIGDSQQKILSQEEKEIEEGAKTLIDLKKSPESD